MPRAMVLQHVPGEGPGRIVRHLVERGLTIELRHLHLGDAVPGAEADDAVLVVMGGPMGIGDIGDARWPFLSAEVALLRRRVERDLPTLGICLGAQLLAHAAGALVSANADATGQTVLEVGWEPVTFLISEQTRENAALLAGMREREWMLHWHGDTFALPDGGVLLASTARCRNQAFCLKRRLVGLQFHPEIDAAMLSVWVQDDLAYVMRANGPGGDRRLIADTQRLMPEHHVVGDKLLRNIVQTLLEN